MAKSFNTDDTCIDNLEIVGAVYNELYAQIQLRMQQLDSQLDASNYGYQKCLLKTEFTNSFGSKISRQYFRQIKGNP